MNEFAVTTGLFPAREPPRRYLWTDAFAVCNFLGLCSATGDETWLGRANELVAQVHDRLGRFRADDPDIERRGKHEITRRLPDRWCWRRCRQIYANK